MKGFSTCFIHMALFLVWWVLFHATFYERVTPFGFCNAPMTFERLMRISLGDYCRFRLASLKFNAQNYKSFLFKVKFMTTRDLIRSSQDWTCTVLVENRNAKQIHSYIEVAKTAVGNMFAPLLIKFTGSQRSEEVALDRVWQNFSLPIYQCSNPYLSNISWTSPLTLGRVI